MGVQIPGELASLLGMLGYNWPQSDESKLVTMGQKWTDFGSTVSEVTRDLDSAARRVWTDNSGKDMDAFAQTWSEQESPVPSLRRSMTGASVVGACFYVCSAIVLALKIQVIVQLVMLAVQIAQAVATAVVTFGASLAEIPIFKMITSTILDFLMDQVLGILLG